MTMYELCCVWFELFHNFDALIPQTYHIILKYTHPSQMCGYIYINYIRASMMWHVHWQKIALQNAHSSRLMEINLIYLWNFHIPDPFKQYSVSQWSDIQNEQQQSSEYSKKLELGIYSSEQFSIVFIAIIQFSVKTTETWKNGLMKGILRFLCW